MSHTPESGTRLLIGTRGWAHTSWTPEFYPEELPPEWRLTFYAHHFGAVLVPPGDWMEAPVERLEQWLMDTGASFRLVLELPEGRDDADLRAAAGRAAILGTRLSALVPANPADFKRLTALLPGSPVAPCWHGRQPLQELLPVPGSRLPLVALLTPGGDLADPVRQLVRASSGFHEIMLFADADPPGARRLQAAAVLLGLG